MKPTRLLFHLAVLVLVVSACEKPEPEKQTVSVSPSSVSFKTEGGSQSVSVTSNGNWYVQTDNNWVQLSATAGAGNGSVTISADANTGAARYATLTFKTSDQATTVSVSQDMYVDPGPVQKSIREVRDLYKGLAFDGNKESLAGDTYFVDAMNRCICVDIRYVLWLLREYGHADTLLSEILSE